MANSLHLQRRSTQFTEQVGNTYRHWPFTISTEYISRTVRKHIHNNSTRISTKLEYMDIKINFNCTIVTYIKIKHTSINISQLYGIHVYITSIKKAYNFDVIYYDITLM